MAISLRKIDQSDHEFSCFDGKDKGKGKGKVIQLDRRIGVIVPKKMKQIFF
jgi:hypothetical protein